MEKKKQFIINVMFYAIIAALMVGFFKFLFPTLVPFIIGFLVACIVRSISQKIVADSDKNKRLTTIVVTIVFYVIFFALLILVGVKMVNGIGNFIQALPNIYYENILPLLRQLTQVLEEIPMELDDSIAMEVEKAINEFQASIGTFISDISLWAVGTLSDGIMGIPSYVVKLIITVVSTFFIAVDFEKMADAVKKVLGDKNFTMINAGAYHTKKVILAYLKSYVLLFCLTFVELSIGFAVLRIPYPVLLAIMIAIFDILPVLGTGGVLIPWALICFVIGNTPLGIGIFLLYVIITAIRNTLEPKIVGKQIGLHPLVTLIAMFVGLAVLGIFGMFLFPVTLVILVSMAKEKESRAFKEALERENDTEE